MSRRALLLAAVLVLFAPVGARATEWGVYYNGESERGFAGMATVRAQGADVVRLPFRWSRIQPEQGGAYEWSEWDSHMRAAAKYRVRVLANVHGTPAWAGSTDPDDGMPHPEAPPTPEHYTEYRAYLRELVGRYGPGGRFWRERPRLRPQPIVEWEIHNEPNVGRFWTDRAPNAGEYADLALMSGKTIKSVDPDARVLVGSTAPTCESSCSEDFLRRVLTRPGLRAASDAVAFHAYGAGPPETLEQAAAVRRAVNRYDSPATPLHLTEFGWGTCADQDPSLDLCVDARSQAKLLTRAFETLAAEGADLRLRTAHWFIQLDLEPCREPGEHFCSFGLIGVGPKGHLDRKPAWSAYRSFTGDRAGPGEVARASPPASGRPAKVASPGGARRGHRGHAHAAGGAASAGCVHRATSHRRSDPARRRCGHG
jgi:hypothetical protein